MNKKYFFFDIDGTLSKWDPKGPCVSKKTIETIKKLKENGHFVALATGRSYAMAKDYINIFDIDNMVCDGGNGFCLNKKLVSIEPLNKSDCITLAKECIDKNIPFAFSPENNAVRITYNKDFDEQAQDTYLSTKVCDKNIAEYDNIYKMYICGKDGFETSLETLHKLPWVRYNDTYIFVEPIDKAHGIKSMMDYLNADYKDVVVFGDQKNDLTMFCDEWFSVAMGNAIDELKEKANYITKTVDEDGVYYACKNFGWI